LSPQTFAMPSNTEITTCAISFSSYPTSVKINEIFTRGVSSLSRKKELRLSCLEEKESSALPASFSLRGLRRRPTGARHRFLKIQRRRKERHERRTAGSSSISAISSPRAVRCCQSPTHRPELSWLAAANRVVREGPQRARVRQSGP
jgi:hypothetical protein